jgi:16S rRNA (guanine1207-N2)-methyltransferase
MRAARLTRALDSGALVLPEGGRILVLRPVAGDDLSALPRARVQVVTGFRPDFDAFAAQGWAVARASEGRFAMAIVCLPRSRAAGRALVAEAAAHLEPGGVLAVDGQKTDGVDAFLRELRGLAEVGEPVIRAHGKLFACRPAPGVFAAWAAQPAALPGGFVTAPGVFSSDAPDPGSEHLAAALPAALPGVVADLGAGWGRLAAAVLAREGVRELHLIEAEADALDCARAAIADPRARFHWADARTFRPERPFDAVVMNPPFHSGRAADPALGAAMIAAAARMLAPHGVLWMVANRHLPYEAALAAAFREVAAAPGSPAYKIVRAARPLRAETRPGARVVRARHLPRP